MIAAGRIQDMILVQESMEQKSVISLRTICGGPQEKVCVLIAGPSSSGKTTFSHRLSIQMTAHGLKHIPFLWMISIAAERTYRWMKMVEYDFECLEALDIPLFNQCMTDLLAGKEVILPVFNFKTGHREYRQKPLKLRGGGCSGDWGIHGLNEKLSYELPKENKYKIYISAH